MHYWKETVAPGARIQKNHKRLDGMEIIVQDADGITLEEGITPTQGNTIHISK